MSEETGGATNLEANHADGVEPTTGYWQSLLSADAPEAAACAPYRFGYPARLTETERLMLPLRPLPDGERATASLIANHASFDVTSRLADLMAEHARQAEPEIVVGLPTLGLAFAPLVAERLGHPHYAPLGYSVKFWYREQLSEPVSSITTPGKGKRLYIDPNLLPRVAGKRAVLVDDAISSGGTILSALSLLERIGCMPERIVVAMRQGTAWRAALAARDPGLPARVHGAFDSPLFRKTGDGWTPIEEE